MISSLHYITQEIPGKTHTQLAEEACLAGIKWVQLRIKNKTTAFIKPIALETLAICRKHGATFILNDHVLLAQEIGADGVHVGNEDMPVSEARKILGPQMIIGATANHFDHIKKHALAGADYIGLGPFRFTHTKDNLSPVLGFSAYAAILKQCEENKLHIPVLAIGGIVPADLPELMCTGIAGVAVAGAINQAQNKKIIVQEFLAQLTSAQTKETSFK